MTEQLVSFLVAKLAKEKGFSTPCSHYYFEDGEFKEHKIETTNGYYGEEVVYELEEFYENWNSKFLTKKNGDRCFGCSKDRGYFETFSAPTQDLLQKWLREKHNIHITIPCIRFHRVPTDIIRYYYEIEKNSFVDNDDTFATYEEALEEGLKQALLLIKKKNYMRPKERIEDFLNKVKLEKVFKDIWKIEYSEDLIKKINSQLDLLKDVWLEHQDWRFSQLLINTGLIPNYPGFWYHKEEPEILEELGYPPSECYYWGQNFDKNMKLLPKTIYKPIKELTTEHLEAILDGGFVNRNLKYKSIMEKELKDRRIN